MSKLLFTTLNTVQALTTPFIVSASYNDVTHDSEQISLDYMRSLLAKIRFNGEELTDEVLQSDEFLSAKNVSLTLTITDEYHQNEKSDIQEALNFYTSTNEKFKKMLEMLFVEIDSISYSELSPRIFVKYKTVDNLFESLLKLSILTNIESINVYTNSESKSESLSLSKLREDKEYTVNDIKFYDQFEAVGFTDEYLSFKKQPKDLIFLNTDKVVVGVLELGDVINRDNVWLKNTEIIYDNENNDLPLTKNHADRVASVIAGENGLIDNNVTIISLRLKEKTKNEPIKIDRFVKKNWIYVEKRCIDKKRSIYGQSQKAIKLSGFFINLPKINSSQNKKGGFIIMSQRQLIKQVKKILK